MYAQKINRATRKVALVLSLIALVTVLFGYTQPRGTVEGDEGTGAHIFQICIAALASAVLLFLATADWKEPRQSARALVLPAAAVALAFAALYYLEHYWLVLR